ncbi:hypothetical protein [Carnimonas bestiolae]|uniref:hypothetical protein n=1 Tax=Carnimonas bestiolae TaxID=3402172 RepID=UPI003EDB77B0
MANEVAETQEEMRQRELESERHAVDLWDELLEKHAAELKPIAHWGDGDAGYLIIKLKQKLGLVDPNEI